MLPGARGPVTDGDTVERINELVIPPAWQGLGQPWPGAVGTGATRVGNKSDIRDT